MDVLEKIFGSNAKVKIIKLFLFNPDTAYDTAEISERTKVSQTQVRKEVSALEKIEFLRPKSFTKEIRRQKNRTVVVVKTKTNGWILDTKFPYLVALEAFLSNINPFKNKDIIDKVSKAGKIQLLIIAGFFIKEEDSRVDLLVVGDSIKQGMLEGIIKTIESEIGKEIRYAVFETSEFSYRYSMFDKLIRDILDYPHEIIINKLGLVHRS